MNIPDSLTTYALSQKYVATAFLVLGGVLFASSVAVHRLSDPSPFLQGFKVGALVCGVLIALGGAGYMVSNNMTHDRLAVAYESNPNEFVGAEQERMAKVVQDFPIYQYVGAAMILAALAIIVFANRPYWSGVAFSVAFLCLGFMFVEFISHASIVRHHDFMRAQGSAQVAEAQTNPSP